LRPVWTDVNIVLTLVPTAVTAVTIAIDKVPAMIAYSMAVAPPSLLRNRTANLMRPLTDRLPHICPTGRARWAAPLS
jgi:hypothetical protein